MTRSLPMHALLPRRVRLSIVTAILGILASLASAIGGEPTFSGSVAPLLQTSCVRCHGKGATLSGDVNLTELTEEKLIDHPDITETLIDVLDLNEMPPDDATQPTKQARAAAVSALKILLRKASDAARARQRAPMRRMNRFQYNNAVIDLFQLNCVVLTLPERMMREHRNYFQPASGRMPDVVHVGSRPLGKSQMIEPRLAGVGAFPQDLRAEHGFDNRGDHLSLSPLLLESFLKLGRSIVESPDFGPKSCGIWKTFFVAPTDRSQWEEAIAMRVSEFLTRAFRRPASSELVARYMGHATALINDGDSFENAMKSVAAAALASPRFLYLFEQGVPSDRPQPLDPFELASRLSFFLWGSIPDEELLTAAKSGDLLSDDGLIEQVDRMLVDRKLKRFCDSFPTQWLQLERIISSAPNRERFPDFYFAKFRYSMHMMLEPLLVFETVLIENRSILELIDSPFTYRSAPLDKIYYAGRGKVSGRTGPTSIPFHRIETSDPREGGVITTAATMTMTSGPERTKPITRGAWLATVIFNNPPAPPPADVPPLTEDPAVDEQTLTLRERLSLHRERASCAGCHEQIDPLGFALENFDPTGKWRRNYPNGRDIDVSGKLFREHEFSDVATFKNALLQEKERFVRGFSRHLLAFALAREASAADNNTIDSIAEAAAKDGYRIKTILRQLVLSDAFRQKLNPK